MDMSLIQKNLVDQRESGKGEGAWAIVPMYVKNPPFPSSTL